MSFYGYLFKFSKIMGDISPYANAKGHEFHESKVLRSHPGFWGA
jgi:hypothetical protein